ncbi:MAG: type II toxin-antitoxin system HicA family toxin [Treponema sp.]|jgi:mRNA interferase HicA|nr:type II toxin-antitoxin system HicA family toxin [Treponema sp.]
MKRKDLIKKLTDNGWWLFRHGGGHDIYTNGGLEQSIPRHTEVKEYLAKQILKEAGIPYRSER